MHVTLGTKIKVVSTALVMALFVFMPNSARAAGLDWECNAFASTGCSVIKASSEEAMKQLECTPANTKEETDPAGTVPFAGIIGITNPENKEVVFSCVNCASNGATFLKVNDRSAQFKWATPGTQLIEKFQLVVEDVNSEETVYGSLCVKVGATPDGACKCGNRCLQYGERLDEIGGGTVVRPPQCGSCTPYPTHQACVNSLAPQSDANASTQVLRGFANDLNKLQVNSLPKLAGIIIKGIMGVVGTIALIMIVYGGVLWMTARGNSEQTGKAQSTVVWAALGIVLIFASYALVDFIFEIFR